MTGFALSWAAADDELPAQPDPPKVVRPRLTCVAHVWGVWMADILTITTPDGVRYAPTKPGMFRRFCRCRAEQKGRGTAFGGDVKVTR